MGIRILSGTGPARKPSGPKILSPSATPLPPEPDPRRWEILESTDIDGWCVVLARYPGCTTYEGRKLLVYPCSSESVRAQTLLDPHFLEDQGLLSPVARFEPTTRGRRLAEALCQIYRALRK